MRPPGLLIPASFSITTPSCANLPTLDPSTFPRVAHLCSHPLKALASVPSHSAQFISAAQPRVPLLRGLWKSPQGSGDATTSTAQSQPQRSLWDHWVPRWALSTEIWRCLFPGDHLTCLCTIDCQAQVSSSKDVSLLTTAQDTPLAGPMAPVPLLVVIPQCDGRPQA